MQFVPNCVESGDSLLAFVAVLVAIFVYLARVNPANFALRVVWMLRCFSIAASIFTPAEIPFLADPS